MKNSCFILFILLALWSCKDDDTTLFDVTVANPEEVFTFDAIPGGAIMTYSVPKDAGVYYVEAQYTNVQNKLVTVRGSYLSTTMELSGFSEARTDVPVNIYLCDRNDNRSAPIHRVFSTIDSGPVAFFDKVKVESSWNGFRIMYDNPEFSKGLAHVFYLGVNPLDHKPDTILIESFPLTPGADTLTFQLKQSASTNTIFIRTEDVKGFRVITKSWENIAAYTTEKYPITKEQFTDPYGYAVEENTDYKYGKEYLFDGETKGKYMLQYSTGGGPFNCKIFLTKPDACGQPFIIDYGKPQLTAMIKMYSPVKVGTWASSTGVLKDHKYATLLEARISNKLPCDVTIYGSDSPDPKGTWTQIGKSKVSPEQAWEKRWCTNVCTQNYEVPTYTANTIDSAEDVFLDIVCDVMAKEYRYVKIVVNDVFRLESYYSSAAKENTNKVFVLSELEVYVKEQ